MSINSKPVAFHEDGSAVATGGAVAAVGPPEAQELQLIRKHDGKALISLREGCRFVPLISG